MFLMVIMVWISWNTDLFWELRNNVLALESAITKSDIFRKPEYAYMHILSKDMIQAIELQEVSWHPNLLTAPRATKADAS